MIVEEDDYLAHYGILRRSGRYPWGSGETEEMRSRDFFSYVTEMKNNGLTQAEIATGVGLTTAQLRDTRTIARAEQKRAQVTQALRLKYEKGMSNVAAAKQMGIPESTFRSLIAPGAKDRADILTSTTNKLREEVEKNKWVDVGEGVEDHLGISKERLRAAVSILREEGYEQHPVSLPQAGTNKDTRYKILSLPGTTQKEAWMAASKGELHQLSVVSPDGGRTYDKGFLPPIAIHPDRVDIRYGSEGGSKTDGLIYVRPGIKDLSLGNSNYAQVRIQVGDSHYLKGMAMYKNNLPQGTDLLFNTNKEKTGNKFDVMKSLESDPLLPFGAVVSQIKEHIGTDKERVTSAMNIVYKEGDWFKWNRNISAQALSKQAPSLAKAQLDRTYKIRSDEYNKIMALTNPNVRKRLLDDFAQHTDASAVHLKAAGFERQNWQVILPIESLKPTEVYAPNFRPGEVVALIRYPHGGRFEIPILTVNNRNQEAVATLGQARDAIGIHSSVAKRLSGADFDGDTVLVIPNNSNKIKSSPALERLQNFDHIGLYRLPDDAPVINTAHKQRLMGDVSNLITDMTIKNAPHSDIVQAVRHSMVVIDAEKHHLNYKQSYLDHNIKALKDKYQRRIEDGKVRSGASTIISLKGSKVYLPDRKLRLQSQGGPIDPATGRLVWVPTGKTRPERNKQGGYTGRRVPKQVVLKRLAITENAHELSSGTPVENIYAEHSNKLKALANQARLSMIRTKDIEWSESARKTYAKEVASLSSKLVIARRNKPRERQAQAVYKVAFKARRDANPNLDKDQLIKIKFQELQKARDRFGAKKEPIKITPEEWNAIQAGAISPSRLKNILANADMELVREYATPSPKLLMTANKTAQAHQLLSMGYTRAEVADKLGVSVSTLDMATIGDDVEEEGD